MKATARDHRPSPVYAGYFDLTEPPFSLTPDPAFLYLTPTHRSALERLRYGIRNGVGFMWVLGEVGTGKSTLCRYLLKELEDEAHTAYVVNPSLSSVELLTAILDDLGLSSQDSPSKKVLLDSLRDFILSSGNRRTAVLIDDAQALPDETLEDLRLLSNLETDKEKLVQVILFGQPELKEKLAQAKMRQVHQRVAIRCELHPLNGDEVGDYLNWRLQQAGNRGQLSVSRSAVKELTRQSGGIPRLVNLLADYALMAAYVAETRTVEAEHVRRAAAELKMTEFPLQERKGKVDLAWLVLTVAVLGLLGVTIVW
ncbi:ExeA family protein [Desulfacinum hydrothermale]|uniref:ExeA family protein n=1 Tax=Desulfacinum hydrothermale TaxID=109258 RepID=UPI001483C75F|nr:AAA family ATPase [Desulfacinum hydrothermale]